MKRPKIENYKIDSFDYEQYAKDLEKYLDHLETTNLVNNDQSKVKKSIVDFYYLDRSDEGLFLIKCGDQKYTAGTDKQLVIDLIERLNKTKEPIVRQKGLNVIEVCWNNHKSNEPCEHVIEIG